jgi:hypothetical protein
MASPDDQPKPQRYTPAQIAAWIAVALAAGFATWSLVFFGCIAALQGNIH